MRTVKGTLQAEADEEDDWRSGRSWFMYRVDDNDGLVMVAHSVNTDECTVYGPQGSDGAVECGGALLYDELCFTGAL